MVVIDHLRVHMAGFLPTAPPFPSKESCASGPHLSVDRWSGRVLIQEMQPLCLERDRHLGLDSSRWINKGRVLSLEEPSGSTNLPEAPTVASVIAAVRPDPSLVVEGPAAVEVAAHPTPVVAGERAASSLAAAKERVGPMPAVVGMVATSAAGPNQASVDAPSHAA